jgi:hypothetical protein
MAPGWFHTLDPVTTPVVAITGSTAAHRRANVYNYVLEYGCGVDPVASEYARPPRDRDRQPRRADRRGRARQLDARSVSADCAFNAVTLPSPIAISSTRSST